jgi:hypothetical protein
MIEYAISEYNSVCQYNDLFIYVAPLRLLFFFFLLICEATSAKDPQFINELRNYCKQLLPHLQNPGLIISFLSSINLLSSFAASEVKHFVDMLRVSVKEDTKDESFMV